MIPGEANKGNVFVPYTAKQADAVLRALKLALGDLKELRPARPDLPADPKTDNPELSTIKGHPVEVARATEIFGDLLGVIAALRAQDKTWDKLKGWRDRREAARRARHFERAEERAGAEEAAKALGEVLEKKTSRTSPEGNEAQRAHYEKTRPKGDGK